MAGEESTQNPQQPQSVPPVMMLPWLGASYDAPQQPVATTPAEPAKTNPYADIIAQMEGMGFKRKNAGMNFGGQQPIYSRALGLNGAKEVIGYRGGNANINRGGSNGQTAPVNGEGYDAGPMQALLAQQLQQGFGGDLVNYQNQLNALYRPMQVQPFTPGSGILDDKKNGMLTGLLGGY